MNKVLIYGLSSNGLKIKSSSIITKTNERLPVFDADAEVRAMQGPDGELLEAIEDAFPGSTGPEGAAMLMHRSGRRWREIKT